MLWANGLLLAAGAVAPGIAIGEGEVPAGWKVTDPPASEAALSCVNRSRLVWTVQGDSSERTRLLRAAHAPRPQMRITLRDGALVGTNHGEFGGNIEWIPHKRGAGFVHSGVNPVAGTEYGGDIYVVEGLSHLGHDQGSLLRFQRLDASHWRIHKVLDLEAAPTAALRVGSSDWMVITSTGVIRIDLASQQQWPVYRNRNWWYSYPDSIRPLGRTWLIGARHAVIRLVPLGDRYIEQWLMPARCEADAAESSD